MSDLTFALRFAFRNPAFSAVTVLVLAVGIGLNTAVFTLINGVLFRALPVPNPDAIRFFYLSDPQTPREFGSVLYRDLSTLSESYREFVDLTARAGDSAQIAVRDDAQPARGESVSSNYFEVLGIKPVIGRVLVPGEDDDTTVQPVVVISHAFWSARLQGDPAAIGTTVALDGRPYTVVGVAPATFSGTMGPWERAQYWVSLEQRAQDKNCRIPDYLHTAAVTAVGRLRNADAGLRLEAAVAASSLRLQPGMVRAGLPSSGRPWPVVVRKSARGRLPFDPAGTIIPDYLAAALMCVSALVLMIAGSNLTGLLLARGVTRREELRTRLTLGASSYRVLRGHMLEHLVLAAPSVVAGVLIAQALVAAFQTMLPDAYSPSALVQTRGLLGITLDLAIDLRVIGFAVVIGVGAALSTAIGPAISAVRSAGLAHSIATPSSTRLRKWILLPQICLSLVLTLTSGVLIRTVFASELRPAGYDGDGAVHVPLALPNPCRNVEWTSAFVQQRRAERESILQRLEARLASLDGIQTTFTSSLPFEAPHVNNQWMKAFDIVGGARAFQFIARADVTAGYFDTLRIPVHAGRDFTDADRQRTPRVAIVSESLARRLWGAGSWLGRHLEFRGPEQTGSVPLIEVVGVVGDVRSPVVDRPVDIVYVPATRDFPWLRAIVSRGTGPAATTIDAVRRAVRETDARVEAGTGRTVAAAASDLQYPRRVAAAILGVSGLAGLMLAALGLYGLLSYSVAQRVNEIGVRMALGADKRDITRLIVGDAFTVTVSGVALGVVLAYVANRITSSRVVPLPPIDGLTTAVVLAVLVAVVLAASYLPARRAGRLDPMEALRHL
jgi:predicted permease